MQKENQCALPLSHITVVSIEQAISAPIATRHLADLGARVIKIERPDVGDFARDYDQRVDGMASHFVWCNRGKESVCLNLKDDADLAALKKLIARADVFVQNLAPGAAKRMGLDYETLSQTCPRLIVCDISGYGAGGPYEQKKAYDLLIQSESGFLSITGTPEEMCKTGISLCDICAGMYAYSNILSSLIMRDQTGKGCHLDISMLESMVEWMGFPLYYTYKGEKPPARAGASHATIYPYGPFQCKDGQVMFGLQNDREWAKFCEIVLLKPELAQDERFLHNSLRSANRGDLKPLIEAAFADLTRAQVTERLEAASIANGNVNEMTDVWAHPQLKARDRWTTVQTPIGEVPALLPPGNNSRFTFAMKPVPALGEHTAAVLAELDKDQ